MRKVEIEIIMCSESFIQHQLQEIAKTLIITEICNGIIIVLTGLSKTDFIVATIISFVAISTGRCFFCKRSETKNKVEINIDEGYTVIIPKGSIIENSSGDECLFETVREYRFDKEQQQ